MGRIRLRTGQAGTAASLAVLVLGGVWVAGGLVSDEPAIAKTATGAWLTASGLLAVVVARLRRRLAVAAIGSWIVTASAAGGLLLVTSSVDRTVDEDVVMAAAPADVTTSSGAPAAVLEAAGRFRSGAHETRGRASLLQTNDGRRVLTLTGFATAPGPDLRVYAVPARTGVEDTVDLGRLKGNKGDQQYVVPGHTRVGSVVIWCRAFSVAFGTARMVDAS